MSKPAEDLIALLGNLLKPHAEQVMGFVKNKDEGLYVVRDGQALIVTVERREKYEGPLPQHKRGFTLYEL